MRRALLGVMTLLSTLAGVVALAPSAAACSCAPKAAADLLADADYVAEVRVERIEQEMSGDRSQDVNHAEVVTVWKGPSSARVTVRSDSDPAACGLPLARHQSYLVVADIREGRIVTDACAAATATGSTIVPVGRQQVVAALGPGRAPSIGSVAPTSASAHERSPWATGAAAAALGLGGLELIGVIGKAVRRNRNASPRV